MNLFMCLVEVVSQRFHFISCSRKSFAGRKNVQVIFVKHVVLDEFVRETKSSKRSETREEEQKNTLTDAKDGNVTLLNKYPSSRRGMQHSPPVAGILGKVCDVRCAYAYMLHNLPVATKETHR